MLESLLELELDYDYTHTHSLLFKNERVTTLNGRRKLFGLLHPAIPSRVTAGIRKRDYYLHGNNMLWTAARLAQLWDRSQNYTHTTRVRGSL